jgi:hypothetical protein
MEDAARPRVMVRANIATRGILLIFICSNSLSSVSIFQSGNPGFSK